MFLVTLIVRGKSDNLRAISVDFVHAHDIIIPTFNKFNSTIFKIRTSVAMANTTGNIAPKKIWSAPRLEVVSILEATQNGAVAGSDAGTQS